MAEGEGGDRPGYVLTHVSSAASGIYLGFHRSATTREESLLTLTTTHVTGLSIPEGSVAWRTAIYI